MKTFTLLQGRYCSIRGYRKTEVSTHSTYEDATLALNDLEPSYSDLIVEDNKGERVAYQPATLCG